ncbi:VOC family protein [Rugamonas rivuli]|uniref:VOC family protein n=1 Tax=Rugamonas rivuli TaxID=2743358 RepID=A0A843SE80_9BURK|nr:VOC family protein [Rugamonas rivuli]MQA20481.1 VOC family protein [Rugamonas rivuli]
MGRPVHFEIQASQPQVLIDFYSALFGWSFNKWEGGEYWLIDTGNAEQRGINGGLLPRQGPVPAAMQSVNAFVCTVDVENLDDTLKQVASLKADVVVPKMPIPGIGWLAYAKDLDGNLFGMMQADDKAA